MSIIVENVSFRSEGHELVGRIYRPNEPGRFPAVSICHGYPGDNKNMDLAEELALHGVATLIFYYRGAWGSGGDFGLKGLEPSARDAIEYLMSSPFVDPDRVGVVGYSLGGIPLAARLASDPRLRTGVFLSAVGDLSILATGEMLEAVVSRFIKMGEGKLRALEAEGLMAELPWVLEHQNPVDLIKGVKVPVFIVVGSEDQEFPPELCRFLFEAANEPKEWLLIEGADHGYSEHRIPLIEAVLGWLKEHL